MNGRNTPGRDIASRMTSSVGGALKGGWRVCASAQDVHRRHCDGSGLHHLIPRFLVIGVVGLVVARRTVGGQRATLCALSLQVLRPVLLRMDRHALSHWTVTARRSAGGQ
jgi:hypothetical protein